MENNEIPLNSKEEWLLADYLANKVIDKASGVIDDECHLNPPRDVYFIGNLRPKNDNEISLSQRDLMQKLSPSAFGAEFKINIKTSSSISVQLKWDCYYRIVPTFDQQKKWVNHHNNEDTQENPTGQTPNTPPDNGNNRPQREDVFVRFRKISGNAIGNIIISNGQGKLTVDYNELEHNIELEWKRIYQAISDDPERMRLRVNGQQYTIPHDSLESMDTYNAFLNTLQLPINNSWKWELAYRAYTSEVNAEEINVLVQFVNASPNREADKTVEPFIFNPKAIFKFAPEILLPFELELAPKSFRYDRLLWGRGFNCGLKPDESRVFFETTNTPTYLQKRYITQSSPAANFDDLYRDPIPVLKNIQTAMESSLQDWNLQESEYRASFGELWDSQYKERYQNDKTLFINEINRFKIGISLIEGNQDILYSFKLMNDVFKRAGIDKAGITKKSGWRLFQIVFIVSQIPGIAALSHQYSEYLADRNFVDIVYFPTGGGKTEAYLGTLVFHCFYDRLRGKTAGVTSWIRFPLRLLTIQQTQRLADVIGLAELVRLEQTDKRLSDKAIHKFSVGYFVGAEGTPNQIKQPQNGSFDPIWSAANDEKERQNWKRVVSCPSCKTNSVIVDFDKDKTKILHRCSNSNCKFINGIIPIYVIDKEIYRYLPTIIVGTIDKLAAIGNQRYLSMVFGKVDGYCKEHGFFNSRCCQDECKDETRLVRNIPPGISAPTLFIQDELHLLREGLGTFDSHYETFAQQILKEFNETIPIKIIASSATIEKYERQVEHLYGKTPKSARVFPGFGVTNTRSFYAETKNYPQRIFVGILPHNKTIFNAILELIEYYHRFIQDLVKLPSSSANPYGGEIQPSSEEWFKLLDLYYSSLSYFSSTRELASLHTDIENHVNYEKFQNEGYNSISIKELTGNTSTDEVTRTLEELERYHNPNESHDAVLATNMVSHGVDIDRLNCMLFYGIPKQNAEYIQASSRVGRSHVGIIFDCFHPIRERDQSHYSYYSKYHEFLGQLVEPVAINRWSTYSIDKTLPGLFMGVLLQILSNRDNTHKRSAYYKLNSVSKFFIDGIIDINEVKRVLKAAYCGTLVGDQRNEAFNRKIDRSVDVFFDNIMAPNSNKSFVSEALYPPPMRSLRDIDESIPIELDSLGSEWGNKN